MSNIELENKKYYTVFIHCNACLAGKSFVFMRFAGALGKSTMMRPALQILFLTIIESFTPT
jgi:hypothetical protein